jgi:hypothetical protein
VSDSSDTSDVEPHTAHLYDAIVQRLVTAKWARQLGHDELADHSLDDALEIARRLSTGAASELLHLTVAA